MAYNSGINQRTRSQIFYSNSSCVDQPISQTNLSLIANLKYVQNWIAQTVWPYLPIINPTFTGTMTGTSINLTGSLSVPTITSNTNFTSIPTIEVNSVKYNISSAPVGTIKMLINNTITPAGFLLCDGTSYLVADYPNLYASIGNTYGGNSTSFNVPNMQSTFPIGGNNVNLLGCATSNFVTGNGQSGATNTFAPTANFGGSTTPVPPLLIEVPSHTHDVNDPGHTHGINYEIVEAPYITVPPVGQELVNLVGSDVTTPSSANVTVLNYGTNIQSTDPVSNLSGVNISPPYVAVFYYIAF
jgi:microcystin-dependent protein